MLPDNADVVVIGAGVIGASIAYQLAKRKLNVVVLEKSGFASGSSGACGGTIFLQTKRPGIHLEMALQSAKRFLHLEEELAANIEYQNNGGMIIIEHEDEMKSVQRSLELQRNAGLEVSLLDQKQSRELEPSLNQMILGATFSSMDAQVNPFFLTFALLKTAEIFGAKVYCNTRVTGIGKASDRIHSVQTDKGDIETETIVNAAGVYAAAVGAMVDLDIPIKPRRGQLVVTEAVEPMIHHCILSAQYIVAKFNPELVQQGGGVSIEQTFNGNFILGTTREFVGFNKCVTIEGMHHIINHVSAILPWIRQLSFIRAFAGLRPHTPDGLPILGRAPGLDGFIIAAGHEGDGIALAPITGELIADLIVDNKTDPLMDAYKLERFSE